ncbi:MAG: vanadium-dependent haloperoxidase [Pseudomonadota bacterium]
MSGKLPFADPDPAGSERARIAKSVRDLSTEISRLNPQALTRSNGEEADHGPEYPANFTKGLLHDSNGLLEDPEDYRCFVEAINAPDPTLFEKHVLSAEDREVEFRCKVDGNETEWRGWESPRAGHVYELQGPDAGAVGMAPAPRVGSSELAAEMAEVYALALLRDVPFTTICEGGDDQLCPSSKKSTAELSAAEVVNALNGMRYFSGDYPVSSTPHNADDSGLNRFERNRRFGRTQSLDGALTTENVFRGSTKGALNGPYVSQFMLVGGTSLAGAGGGASSFPGQMARFDLADGFIPYGSITVDQRTISHKNCVDYMTDWCSWLDVQNGANFKGADVYEEKRRFITTPRDLATYVHFDALYEAYLNACLAMLALGVPASKGFPEPSPSGRRDAFATFGGPHILSLVTEVATRCLKAVRRQKFNYHRRARPETLGGRVTLACLDAADQLGCAGPGFVDLLNEIPAEIRDAIIRHNANQNSASMGKMRRVDCKGTCRPNACTSAAAFKKCNLLLPMAFPEGSPMHPAYGAGHATVAGGCVTMLKAFFEMFTDCNSYVERPLIDGDGNPIVFVPNADGSKLVKDRKTRGPLTVQGELDKLAANISIGRNMAGVHYYSDYYDSLRMGERIAVGILLEQAPTYGDAVESTFKSFDGDYVTLSGEAGSCPSLSIVDRNGCAVSPRDWWLRHVSGQELSEDL